MTWQTLRDHGLAFWLPLPTLRTTAETLARNQYNEKQDPVSCSLLYLALRKKTLLLNLWKRTQGNPESASTVKFLANDFTLGQYQTSACKNAFALLGKQRYEYAAAFFLLADKLSDAVNVCIKHLNDVQLAVCLCRLYEGEDSATLKHIINETLVPSALEQGDRAMLCILNTYLKKPLDAYFATHVLANGKGKESVDPGMYLLYTSMKAKRKVLDSPESIEAGERLAKETAEVFMQMGMSGIALHVLDGVGEGKGERKIVESVVPVEVDWSAPVAVDEDEYVSGIAAYEDEDEYVSGIAVDEEDDGDSGKLVVEAGSVNEKDERVENGDVEIKSLRWQLAMQLVHVTLLYSYHNLKGIGVSLQEIARIVNLHGSDTEIATYPPQICRGLHALSHRIGMPFSHLLTILNDQSTPSAYDLLQQTLSSHPT